MPSTGFPAREVGNFAWKGVLSAAGIAAALVAAAVLAAMLLPKSGTDGTLREWVPDSPRTVVLEFERNGGVGQRLVTLRKNLGNRPGDAEVAAQYAELALQHYAATGDARNLGYAEGALLRWSSDRSPPAPIWILRGRLLQTQHRFSEAAEDLDRMLAHHPGSIEGLLLSADAWRRSGNLAMARSRCARLALAGWPDFARYCAADVYLSLGEPEKAWQIASLRQSRAGGMATAQWEQAVKADAAAAAGRPDIAETHYLKALATPRAPLALHLAYADLLLSSNRAREALDALANRPNADAVLLRRAIAAKKLGLAEFEGYRARLMQSFADAEALGAGSLHLRERAMFEQYVEADAVAALGYARENWRIQKGPEDAQILVDAAEAAGRPEEARVVADWRLRFKSNVD